MNRPKRSVPAQPAVEDLDSLLAKVRACRVCAAHLAHGPRPVVQAGVTARLLIVGQAPGARVHASGIPWDDASGTRLREWLQMERDCFYDPGRVAIIPMGFCYPGKGRSGDLPPRPECAPLWFDRLRACLPEIRLTLLIGQYAQRYGLGARAARGVGATVADFDHRDAGVIALPHPSPRNIGWFKANPWFEERVLPDLRRCVGKLFCD